MHLYHPVLGLGVINDRLFLKSVRTGRSKHIVEADLCADKQVSALTEDVSAVATLDLLNHISVAHIGKAIRRTDLGGQKQML